MDGASFCIINGIHRMAEMFARQWAQLFDLLWRDIEIAPKAVVIDAGGIHRCGFGKTGDNLPVMPSHQDGDDPSAGCPANVPDGRLIGPQHEHQRLRFVVHHHVHLRGLVPALIDLHIEFAARVLAGGDNGEVRRQIEVVECTIIRSDGSAETEADEHNRKQDHSEKGSHIAVIPVAEK